MAIDSLAQIKGLVKPDEVIEPSSSSYGTESATWAAQKNLHPRLVIRPQTIASLSKVLVYLSKTSLDFAIRGHGYGSSSARDVVISTTAFDEFDFDREQEVVTLGAGQTWEAYYTKMEQVAPDYAVVACRTPGIGIGGSILHGGFSWLSSEFGLTSDPRNMLDAQIVKLDGQVVWASEEPDLLWALRGAGSSFGVVTTFKLRAHPYTQSIFAGPIFLPKNTFTDIAPAIAKFTSECQDGKMAMFMYVLRKELLTWMDADQDMLVMHVFDARGEEHGRSNAGFGWALKLKGAIDGTKVMSLRQVSELQGFVKHSVGKANSYISSLAVPDLTEEVILRSFEWFDTVSAAWGSVKDNGMLIFEVMTKAAFNHKSLPRESTAWPHPQGAQHILLLGTGCNPDASESENQLARKLVMEGHQYILEHEPVEESDFITNSIEDFHDMSKIYGEHFDKLQKLKRTYDPVNRLKGPISLTAWTYD